jgi:uncharacterized protein YdiU (UPF0061 family)
MPLPGAVLTRVASSHIRVGTFQFFAARGEGDKVRRLLDYTIARHYPALSGADNHALALLEAVIAAQADLIAAWMSVGFIHGVMNTDNMTLSGETIDYGPCAFMDDYAPDTVFSSIDQTGRYAYGNQPLIGQWNLARLAEALLPLIDADGDKAVTLATDALRRFTGLYETAWLRRMRTKLGLRSDDPEDITLVQELLAAMEGQGADWTLTFRRLSSAVQGDAGPLRMQFADPARIDPWTVRYFSRLQREGGDPAARAAAMDLANPAVIPRNHKVEEALAAATQGDLAPFETLLTAITDPYTEQPGREAYLLPPPSGFTDSYRTFCGT